MGGALCLAVLDTATGSPTPNLKLGAYIVGGTAGGILGPYLFYRLKEHLKRAKEDESLTLKRTQKTL